jgi:hypothetical protein
MKGVYISLFEFLYYVWVFKVSLKTSKVKGCYYFGQGKKGANPKFEIVLYTHLHNG